MADTTPQTFQNHARFDPIFHFFALPVLLINAIVCVVRLVRDPSIESGRITVVAFALVIVAFKARVYALKVQDRVIRLEERLRMSSALSEPLRSRCGELTEGQMVALRFAPDGELPVLVEKCLAGSFQKQGDIKKAIVNWRADYFRV